MSPRELSTLNRHAVTAHRGRVLVMNPPRSLDAAEALELAAWLVVGAELADPGLDNGAALACVTDLVARIRNT